MRLLITGGTGFLGRALVQHFRRLPEVERVVSYARGEARQARLREALGDDDKMRYFIGDIRDPERLVDAMATCDTVIHTAALKRVDAIASNAIETRRTNVEGSANVTRAAIQAGVRKVVMISSDKAVTPTNYYGSSKSQMEHEAIGTNAISWPKGTAISCVRYGNVVASTGSVLPIWYRAKLAGEPLRVTDPKITRFWITLPEALAVVHVAVETMQGGEIFVPELRAMALGDLREAFAPEHPWVQVGLRPGGEKMHETLINLEEASRTVCAKHLFVVRPSLVTWRGDDPWADHPPIPVIGTEYRSDLVERIDSAEMRAYLDALPWNDLV